MDAMTRRTREDEVRALLGEAAKRDASSVATEADLVEELGLDSLAALRLLALTEMRFGVRFPDERLGEFRSIRALVDFLDRNDTDDRGDLVDGGDGSDDSGTDLGDRGDRS